MGIRLIVGLGNPGAEYDGTRHNAGFDWLAAAADELGARPAVDKAYQGLVARATPRGPSAPVWLLMPMTYMNLSGRAVGPLAKFFKIPADDILVVHDELDLAPGEAKLKKGGGSAGHNGLKDITAALGTPDYWRLRIGIGHPGDRNEVAGYVLRRAPAAEREAIAEALRRTLAALPLLIDGAMERATQAMPLPKPVRPHKPKAPTAAASPAAPTAPDAAAPQGPATPAASEPGAPTAT